MNIAVIGAGAWGTALALHFHRCGHTVSLFAENQAMADEINQHKENILFFKGFRLPENLTITADYSQLKNADLILAVVPTAALRQVAMEHLQKYAPKTPVLAACKGFEKNTGLLPHQVLKEVLPENPYIGLLSGPSFAKEVALALPCAVCIASDNTAWADEIATQLNSTIMRMYANHDPIGVAVGGAVKNVIAVAAGVADGLKFGLNARAALLTRGLAEITRLALALGANATTMMGLAGMGDLILTATGDLSRNRQVGLKFAENKPLPQILQELGHVAEGINTIAEVNRMAEKHGIDMPITRILFDLINDKITAQAAVEQLMLREPKSE
ncbi:MAG: NAD(P)-dependent glycerol-3-phosphate dehydrogenase [Neisseriaceae bacterium]|nr:NAD(P)-dependent glycerol-3-phosphate dehydrogenase [Neisseriaceae bacterium]